MDARQRRPQEAATSRVQNDQHGGVRPANLRHVQLSTCTKSAWVQRVAERPQPHNTTSAHSPLSSWVAHAVLLANTTCLWATTCTCKGKHSATNHPCRATTHVHVYDSSENAGQAGQRTRALRRIPDAAFGKHKYTYRDTTDAQMPYDCLPWPGPRAPAGCCRQHAHPSPTQQSQGIPEQGQLQASLSSCWR